MHIANSQISQVAVEVCNTMLDMQIANSSEENPPVPLHFASVFFSGAKEATIEVAVCQTAAEAVSRAMFGYDEEVAEDDIADAVSELVNMIGGNLKGLLGADCSISIPVFSTSGSCEFHDEVEQVAFEVEQGWMQVSLYTPG